ncbi:MAG: family 1 glycosylhydrolase [Eubacteriales bacterium]|nr:family 1 glycosylhydrolase [Eubacteriales bacterium]
MSKLPKGFLVGAATAAHQVEGNNIHSDYWAMEQMEHTSFNEPSLECVDHYRRYEEDIRLMAEAGLNAYRFSIEWARIEPEQGVYDESEIAHYRKVLECCRKNGIEPIVTMHHFSSPKWLIANGGWENEATIDAFANYCAYVVEQLGDLMQYVSTINEANMGLQIAEIAERYKRQMMEKMQAAMTQKDAGSDTEKKAVESSVQVGINMQSMGDAMKKQQEEYRLIFGTAEPQTFVSARTKEGDILVMRAHQAARKAMKAVRPELKIGITMSLHDIQAVEGGEEMAKRVWENEFLHYLPYIREDDFFGLQNYTRSLIGRDKVLPVPEDSEKTQMDYEYYPQALGHVIRKVHEELDMPIMITENGVGTGDDSRRTAFIQEALKGVVGCLADGIPVLGYMYWSLLDNFEWQKGFSMTFGLIAVDRKTQTRYPKESLKLLGSYTNR